MIYLLRRIDFIGWDEYDIKIIRADSEQEARLIANENVGDEGKMWENSKRILCERILETGDAKEILGSFNAG